MAKKDKVFSKYAPTLSNDAAYQAYLDDQEKRRKEAEEGKVRYVEAAKASRIQYTLPQYQGKSQNQGKTYQWERDLMQNEKIKGAGNSYTKKFDALTARMGMTDTQAEEFRKFMDFQEDSQHVDPKLNKDKSIKQNQSLKYARDARLKADVIDGILNNMHKKSTAIYKKETKKEKEVPFQKVTGWDKIQNALGIDMTEEQKNTMNAPKLGVEPHFGGKKAKTDPVLRSRWEELQSMKEREDAAKKGEEKGERGGIYGLLDRYVLPFSQAATEVILPGNEEVQIQNELDKYGEITNPATQAGMVDRGLETDILNFAGTTAGYLAPYGQGYKAVNAALNLPKLGKAAQFVANNPYKGRAAVGGAAGLLAESGLAATNELANSEANDMGDYALRTALGVAGGAIGDPLLHGAGNLIKNGLPKLNPANQAEQIAEELTDLYTRNLSERTPNDTPAPPVNALAENPLDAILNGQPDAISRLAQQDLTQPNSVNLGGSRQPAPNVVETPQAPVTRDATASNERPNDDELANLFGRLLGEDAPPPRNNIVNNSQAPEEVLEQLVRGDAPSSDLDQKLKDFFGGGGQPSRDQMKQAWIDKLENTGFTADEAIEALGAEVSTLDNEILYELAGRPLPKPETEAISPAPASDVPTKEQIDTAYSQLTEEANRLVQERPEGFMEEVQKIGQQIQQIDEAVQSGDPDLLVKLNLQRFALHAPTSLVETRTPISTEGPIAKQSNPVKRTISKFYEGYVNRNHSAKLTEVQSLETAISKAKTEGRTKKAEQLTQRLKDVKKHGSDFDKALGNELASSSAAKNVLDRHFASLSDTMGGDMKEMSGALEFQMAKNLDWIRNNVDPNYELPQGWDWGMINDVINNGANNAKYGEFVDQFRNMTQELRDTRLDYGLISKESHEALGKNPFYIPMQRDMTQVMDNIDIGNVGIGRSTGRGSGDGTLHKLDGGSVETFFKNPMETVIDQTFQLYKTAYRNDTAQQALKMARLDKDGTLGLAKEIRKKNVKPGDLTVYVNGQKKYVRLQDDLVKMMNENESVLDLGKIGKVTQMFAALKTRSFEYQTAAAPRDLAQAYLTSQVGNPVRYFGEMMKAIKNKNANAKEVGAYFDKAYNDHVAGVDPNKILKEFQQQAGNVKTFNVKDPKSWKEVGGVVKKILDTPFKPSKFLGQITDEIPREIEVKEAERLFMKKHGKQMEILQNRLAEVDQQLQAAEGITDPFDPALQGIDKLKGQKDKIERTLRQFNQDLKREQVYRGRDVMDYSRMGNSKATKNIIRPWVIFANTTTQSKDKVIRSFIERPGATIAKMTAITAPFVAAEKINFDNMNESDRELYDNLPSWLKQFNYVYIDNGTTYAVPKLHELALVTNPIEAALKGDSLDDSMKLLAKETVPYQLGNVAQGLVPDEEGKTLSDRDPMTKNVMGVTAPSTVLGPIGDVMFNDKTTFNRKPISYSSDKSNKWTMDLFTDLIGKEPNADAAQYLYQQYLGDFGKYSSYIGNAAKDPTNQEKVDEMLRYLNPLQDRMYKENSRYFRTTPQETKK